MTDNEIIQALECCGDKSLDCTTCPYYDNGQYNCTRGKLFKDAVAAINRQKAEIERLNEYISRCKSGEEYWVKCLLERPNEAIKEFADELHTEIHQALESNYKAKAARMAKPNIDMADEFVSYCEGKIAALRGIDDFIDETHKKCGGNE